MLSKDVVMTTLVTRVFQAWFAARTRPLRDMRLSRQAARSERRNARSREKSGTLRFASPYATSNGEISRQAKSTSRRRFHNKSSIAGRGPRPTRRARVIRRNFSDPSPSSAFPAECSCSMTLAIADIRRGMFLQHDPSPSPKCSPGIFVQNEQSPSPTFPAECWYT